MNWIIKSNKKVKFHTNLKEVIKPFEAELDSYIWVLSDLDFIGDENLPINFHKDVFILSAAEFSKLTDSYLQIIWGVISAIPICKELVVDHNSLPFVEGNDLIRKNGNLQLLNSKIEIIAFDSSNTIVKFDDLKLSEIFKNYFEEARELEKYKGK